MIRKIRLSLLYLTMIIIGIFTTYSSVFWILNPETPTYQDCGVVKGKSTNDVVIKYGTHTQLYLIVNFEHSGEKSVQVTPATLLDTKIGETVCFNLDTPVSIWYHLKFNIGILNIVFSILGALVLFFGFIFGGFENK